GPASCAGNSSRRAYLSGNSDWISNSIGTRFSPRTWRVGPLAMKVFTAGILASPPSAARAAASTVLASFCGGLDPPAPRVAAIPPFSQTTTLQTTPVGETTRRIAGLLGEQVQQV